MISPFYHTEKNIRFITLLPIQNDDDDDDVVACFSVSTVACCGFSHTFINHYQKKKLPIYTVYLYFCLLLTLLLMFMCPGKIPKNEKKMKKMMMNWSSTLSKKIYFIDSFSILKFLFFLNQKLIVFHPFCIFLLFSQTKQKNIRIPYVYPRFMLECFFLLWNRTNHVFMVLVWFDLKLLIFCWSD